VTGSDDYELAYRYAEIDHALEEITRVLSELECRMLPLPQVFLLLSRRPEKNIRSTTWCEEQTRPLRLPSFRQRLVWTELSSAGGPRSQQHGDSGRFPRTRSKTFQM
jgi:hypothetical protein